MPLTCECGRRLVSRRGRGDRRTYSHLDAAIHGSCGRPRLAKPPFTVGPNPDLKGTLRVETPYARATLNLAYEETGKLVIFGFALQEGQLKRCGHGRALVTRLAALAGDVSVYVENPKSEKTAEARVALAFWTAMFNEGLVHHVIDMHGQKLLTRSPHGTPPDTPRPPTETPHATPPPAGGL